ncbi:hypothetical protein [Aliikangiella maris]|uniref:Uncharacterized protein n=2 Tax=Aliikangiella maris TaxID=3162458 RepID=A0ABV2C087_9GAMM
MIVINNTSAVDAVTINSLVDNVHGDLNGQGDCSVPQVILPAQSYTYLFNVYVTGDVNQAETDVIAPR